MREIVALILERSLFSVGIRGPKQGQEWGGWCGRRFRRRVVWREPWVFGAASSSSDCNVCVTRGKSSLACASSFCIWKTNRVASTGMPTQTIEAQDEDIRPCVDSYFIFKNNLSGEWLEPCAGPLYGAPWRELREGGGSLRKGVGSGLPTGLWAFSTLQGFAISPSHVKMYYLVWAKLTLKMDEWLKDSSNKCMD